MRVEDLTPDIVNHEPRNLGDIDILEEVAELQARTYAITITAKKERNSDADKYRSFCRLQRQLRTEIEKAGNIGTLKEIDYHKLVWAREWASKSIRPIAEMSLEAVRDEVLDLELNDVGGRIREIMKILINNRLELENEKENEKGYEKEKETEIDECPGSRPIPGSRPVYREPKSDPEAEDQEEVVQEEKSDGSDFNEEMSFALAFLSRAR
jgi:hypothetical protein